MPTLFGQNSALGGPLEVAFLDEKRFVNLFKGMGFFAHSDGHGAKANGPAAIVFRHHAHHLLVHLIEATRIDLQ